MTLGDRLHALSHWVDGALWRSWLLHTLAALFVLIPLIGPAPTAVLFLVREGEQWFHTAPDLREPWYDYPMDVLGPLVAGYLWEVVWQLPNLAGWLYTLRHFCA